MPTYDSDRPRADQAFRAPDSLQRWRYQGRRHQSGLPPRQRTIAALLGTAAAALLLILAVAVWPTPRRTNVVLPEIPRAPLTFTPSLPSSDGAGPSAMPSPDGASATTVPSGPPPLPTQSADPPGDVVKPPAPPAPVPPHDIPITAFEAESAANMLFGQARIRRNADASGGQAIGFLGTGDGSTGALRVNNLKVPTPGTYTLTIFYISGSGDRGARISVNGGVLAAVPFPSTGDWTTIGSLTLRVRAHAGNNFVDIDNPSDWAPDIDRVVLSN